ncbi:MAG: Peptide chain release factor 1 [Alphaproteobacteria bacterium ADurb.Bin438]|nr:MAG: Peptide chain release factor 1 [Alphaproteobacteria bacterium ADurb.Bin438]
MNFDEKLETIVSRHDELKALLSTGNVDGQEFVRLSKEMASLDEMVETIQAYKELKKNMAEAKAIMEDASMDSEMRKMGEEEYYSLKEELPEAEKKIKILLIPKDEADAKNAILEVRAGTGGEEAALFAANLFRMYEKYANSRGWKFEILNLNETGIGGYKEAAASISGKDVFSKLKFESGAHRVQRVPDTEASGRVHTSAATVAVLPEAEEVDVKINEADIKMDTFRASGAGGQHVNKTDSAVRLTHIPTGVVVECQEERSQFKNRDKAMARLRAYIYDAERQRIENEMSSNRKEQVGSGDRSERIRTYNFPQGRVTDHRINLTLYKIDEVMEGAGLDEIISALIEDDQLKKLSELS